MRNMANFSLFVVLIFSHHISLANDLAKAVEQENMPRMEALIKNGADINAVYEGWTALLWAARKGNEKAIQILLANKTDIHAKDAMGYTALMMATQGGREKMA